ncbi:hypothetical protein DTO063F5_8031 [Paecilomyces variotii]|nr:hypothetical protein DTO063F5_8031 [Paecilomyces variotii]
MTLILHLPSDDGRDAAIPDLSNLPCSFTSRATGKIVLHVCRSVCFGLLYNERPSSSSQFGTRTRTQPAGRDNSSREKSLVMTSVGLPSARVAEWTSGLSSGVSTGAIRRALPDYQS